ncbi:hypothetical protein CDAR_59781 [Caerostris darwini]|uniref:Uncharacterized protein n=1 Tax=Caerostris darwini TaxID=1538125 RepID=A0AAV4RSH9_9ARAC|nr:hypothetical protein CDAR_59781 [Caerostris darwini]
MRILIRTVRTRSRIKKRTSLRELQQLTKQNESEFLFMLLTSFWWCERIFLKLLRGQGLDQHLNSRSRKPLLTRTNDFHENLLLCSSQTILLLCGGGGRGMV